MSDNEFRTNHTREWRCGDVRHAIDPGFIHFRKIETILGPNGMAVEDDQFENFPLICLTASVTSEFNTSTARQCSFGARQTTSQLWARYSPRGEGKPK